MRVQILRDWDNCHNLPNTYFWNSLSLAYNRCNCVFRSFQSCLCWYDGCFVVQMICLWTVKADKWHMCLYVYVLCSQYIQLQYLYSCCAPWTQLPSHLWCMTQNDLWRSMEKKTVFLLHSLGLYFTNCLSLIFDCEQL